MIITLVWGGGCEVNKGYAKHGIAEEAGSSHPLVSLLFTVRDLETAGQWPAVM
jgi:hypothetical protein